MSTPAQSGGTKIVLPSGDRLSHAYILVSPEEDKLRLSSLLAAHMLCRKGGDEPCMLCSDCRKIMNGIHPDVIAVERPLDDKGKPKREIYVAQIRDLLSDSVVLPNEADYKVYVILDAEYMNPQAQNALLKLLEEPPEKVKFILCAENSGVFLDTIRSRCIEITARGENTVSVSAEAVRYLELAGGSDRLALIRFCSSMEELSPAQLEEFILGASLLIGETLARRRPSPGLSQHRLMEIHALLTRCLTYLSVNVSVKQVLGLISVRTIG